MNRTDYSKSRVVKNALLNMDSIMNLSLDGDSVAHSIWIDIDDALSNPDVLSERQGKFLSLWLEGYRQIDIATIYKISQKQVSVRINRAVVNISKYLRRKVDYLKGNYRNMSDKPNGYSTNLEISEGVRCAGCCFEFKMRDLVLEIDSITSAYIYRCKKCHDDYMKRPKHKYDNPNPVERGEYCPICKVILTTEKKCGSGLH